MKRRGVALTCYCLAGTGSTFERLAYEPHREKRRVSNKEHCS